MAGEQISSSSGDAGTTSLGAIQLNIFDSFENAENIWRNLESQGLATLYQRYDWVSAWTATIGEAVGSKPRIVVATQDAEALFVLPLSIRKAGSIKLVEWLADSHSNFQMGLYSKRFLQNCEARDMAQVMSKVVQLLGGADIMSLRCQPDQLFGYKNPMAGLPGHESSNPAFSLDLTGGFDAALARVNGTKRRKKYRWQMKQLGDDSRVRLKLAATQVEVETILQTAFQHMAIRFGKLGIKNVFADTVTRGFFQDLASPSLGNNEWALCLYALEIDGKIRATLVGGQNGSHFSACFISLAEDEMAFLSPGQLLFYRVLEDCASRNVTSFDFGRGEESYKRSWTNQEIAMIDVTLPFTAMGRSLATLQRSKSEAKRLIRSNERLWGLAKQMRSTLRRAS